MSIIRQIRADIVQRKNLDTYATIGVAVTVACLSYFDLVSPEKTTTLVLAVLAILAFNGIATRTAVESGIKGVRDRFNSEFPQDMIQKREACDDIFLIGVSLDRTIESSYGAFERNLKRGSKIRILLTHPYADPAALDAQCQVTRPATQDIRQKIEHSLKLLTSLKKSTSGDLEVRLTRSALKFGLQSLMPANREAEMHVQLYSYRLSGESRPMFILTHEDGEWFDCFATQAENLWADAEEESI